MQNQSPPLSSRQYELDLLRFLAALAVVLFHYTHRAYGPDNLSPIPYSEIGKITRYGLFGVQLFFIISGYVILLSVEGKTVQQFLVSRIQRLYPAYWVAGTLTFVVVRLWGSGPTDTLAAPLLQVESIQYLLNMTMLQEFLGAANLDQAYWTLTVELCFYFIISLLMAYKLMPHLSLVIGLWLAYALVASKLGGGKILPLLLIPQHAPFFIAGMLFYQLRKPANRTLERYALLVVTYGAAMRVGYAKSTEDLAFAVVAGIITSFFIVIGLVAFGKLNLSRQAWLPQLGALTYPLYLLHGHIGYVAFHRLGPYFNKYVLLAVLLIVMLVASYLLTRWVEKPLSRVLGQLLNRLFAHLNQPFSKAVPQGARRML